MAANSSKTNLEAHITLGKLSFFPQVSFYPVLFPRQKYFNYKMIIIWMLTVLNHKYELHLWGIAIFPLNEEFPISLGHKIELIKVGPLGRLWLSE